MKRECLRCGAVEAIYPWLVVVLTNLSKLNPKTLNFVSETLGETLIGLTFRERK